MTSVLLDDEIMLGELPDRIIKCENCSGWADIAWFENVQDLSNLFLVERGFDFKTLQKKTGEIVSSAFANNFRRFEFSSLELAESFHSAVSIRVSLPTSDRVFCLSEPRQEGEKYIVSFYETGMNFYCENCTFICESCDVNYINYANKINTFEGDNICESCYEDNYFSCENCDNVFLSGRSQYIHDRSAYWCEGCASDEASWCEYHASYEEVLCDSNYSEDDVENWNRQDYEGIYSYNFKPAKPDFFLGSLDSDNQKLTFGFELEVESEGARFSDGLKIIRESLGDFVYMKGDGSLNCGYEIVTYPFSFNYYQEAIDFSFLGKLQELGYRSWTPETCGFHIHIARAGFESAGHIWKFANLILQNPRAWQKLAGRSGSRWASYSETDNPVMKVLKGESEPMRYVAVNMTNPDTIEVRIFRGSLNETRIRSAIESIYCAMEYTRNLSVHDINQGGLKFEAFINWVFTGLSGLRSQMAYQQGSGFLAEDKKLFLAFETLLKKYELINSESIAQERVK